MNPNLLAPASTASPWSLFLSPKQGFPSLAPPQHASRSVHIEVNQPLYNRTGMLRWAINDISSTSTPSCSAYRKDLVTEGAKAWFKRNSVRPGFGQSYPQTGQQLLDKSMIDNSMVK